ncbi:hypothetical protein ACIBG5_13695 [Kribbella sp. NPDC050241]|uniref:hypothetical protein n=1 Tax=Kribbella sp. NPDC050241 TaxID=3364115 RepID=UPI00379CB892
MPMRRVYAVAVTSVPMRRVYAVAVTSVPMRRASVMEAVVGRPIARSRPLVGQGWASGGRGCAVMVAGGQFAGQGGRVVVVGGR